MANIDAKRKLMPDGLPETGYVRIGDITRALGLTMGCWYSWVRTGRAPRPIKLSRRAALWLVDDIRAMLRAAKER